MPVIMSRAELVADLRLSLQDAANVFTASGGADFSRHLDAAALDFSRIRPRTLLGEITLVADQFNYPAPADLLTYKSSLWGVNRYSQPWDKHWPGRLPDVLVAKNGGVRELHFSPPPTAQQIATLSSAYKFWYFAAHAIADAAAETTILSGDRGLLLLRAQAEAMRELAMRNAAKPVQMRDGISGSPRNGTPSYLFELLMKEFEGLA